MEKSNNQVLPEGVPDADTLAILDEMQGEGITDDSDPRNQSKEEGEEKGEGEEEKPEPKNSPDSEQEKEEEGEPDKKDEENEEEKDGEPESDKNTDRYMPLKKYNKAKEKWTVREQELLSQLSEKEQKLEELNKITKAGKIDEDVQAYADKHGIEKDAVLDLLGIAEKHFGIDQKALSEIQKYKQQETQEIGFNNEFSKTVLPVIKEHLPNLTDSQLNEVKAELKKLAFADDKAAKLPLDYFLYKNLSNFKGQFEPREKRKAMDNSKSGLKHGNLDLDSRRTFDEDGGANLSDEEFDRLSNEMASSDRLKSYKATDRNGKPINIF